MNEDPLGFVETPPALADWLASEVLLTCPDPGDRILYPGAGRGNIAAAVHRRCSVRDLHCPDAVFVERDEGHLDDLRDRFVDEDATYNHGVPPVPEASRRWHRPYRGPTHEAAVDTSTSIHARDFLRDPPAGLFEYVVANPPFTAYPNVDPDDREDYAERFETACGQFGLYAPFVEQMLDLLAPNGVLAVLLPVQWFTTRAARALRSLVRRESPCTSELVPEVAFPDHQVVTNVAVIGRADADWVGRLNPPWETRLGLTSMRGHYLRDLLDGLGVDEGDLESVVSEYVDSFELTRRLVANRDRRERQDLEPMDEAARRQRSLAAFQGDST